jgi:hypothetical protein
MKLSGLPVTLGCFRAETLSNSRFERFPLPELDRIFLPPLVASLMDVPPLGTQQFIEDDNRGAILPQPIATLDGVPFYLSVKGIGSAVDPFSAGRLDRELALQLSDDPALRQRFSEARALETDRMITGELWLRGSPYGGQGLEHAQIALRVAERADVTSIAGFLIAPVVKIAFLPAELQERLRSVYWYRRYRGPIVQELRLVPSNFRIYFQSRSTVGGSARALFDAFGIDSPAAARRFEVHFVRSTVAMLTLFARTLTRGPGGSTFRGLDFHDVWLDKDAVIAPNGSAYFVDLEGIEEISVAANDVAEKFEDQIYRSLYEFMFAYEQLDLERRRRFGDPVGRREQFASIVLEALHEDPFARPMPDGRNLLLEVRNPLAEESLYTRFPLVDY